jgi:hypothetical protein
VAGVTSTLFPLGPKDCVSVLGALCRLPASRQIRSPSAPTATFTEKMYCRLEYRVSAPPAITPTVPSSGPTRLRPARCPAAEVSGRNVVIERLIDAVEYSGPDQPVTLPIQDARLSMPPSSATSPNRPHRSGGQAASWCSRSRATSLWVHQVRRPRVTRRLRAPPHAPQPLTAARFPLTAVHRCGHLPLRTDAATCHFAPIRSPAFSHRCGHLPLRTDGVACHLLIRIDPDDFNRESSRPR